MRRWASALWLSLLALGYVLMVVPGWNLGHMDFGDGNYMYIGWRMAAGEMLYRDVLAPQPPIHLILAAIIHKIGAALLDYPLYAFRSYSLLIHLATMLLVHRATIRLGALAGGLDEQLHRPFLRPAGLAAATVYMLLPLGFWWTLGYQSEPTEMLFLVGGFHQLLTLQTRRLMFAGLLFGLGPLTNMTAAPYALYAAGWVAVRRPRQALAFILPMLGIIALTVLIGELWTGCYLENVIFNQVGSFPRKNPVEYAIAKILNQGAKVARLEGAFIVMALAGLMMLLRRATTRKPALEIAIHLIFFSLCSIAYTAKGGTMDYIFTIGEPYVAITAGLAIAAGSRRWLFGWWERTRRYGARETSAWLLPGILAMLAFWVMLPGIGQIRQTLAQDSYELPQPETLRIVNEIQRASKPGDLVLSPPHYAYLAQRKIAENYSESYLWLIKYLNEKDDNVVGKGRSTAERIAKLLTEKKIACIVLDEDQTGSIPEIRSAIDANYTAITQDIRTLNRRLRIYRPRP